MAKFVIETEHTPEECLAVLDEAVKMGTLEKSVFGCNAGEHKSWAYVEAKNGQEAIESVVPSSLRDNATAHEVTRLTEEDIKAAHQ